jgi:hypothetical protein
MDSIFQYMPPNAPHGPTGSSFFRILQASHFGGTYPPSLSNSNSSCVAASRKNSASSGLKGSSVTSKTGSPSRLTGYSLVSSP